VPDLALFGIVAAFILLLVAVGRVEAVPAAWKSMSRLALIVPLAFICEYVDSTLGMGYGTTLTPFLLLAGFAPLAVVPAILVSELVTGLAAGAMHHGLGNVKFHRGSPHLRIVAVLAICSLVGSTIAAALALGLSAYILKLYIGLLMAAVGAAILVCGRRPIRFSWQRIMALGVVAAFNKGISGGGYGPVVTSGQILAGVEERSSVAITSLAEGITCIGGVITYLILGGAGIIDWTLTPYLVGGALLSVPLSAVTVRRVKVGNLRLAVGILTLLLGLTTVLRTCGWL